MRREGSRGVMAFAAVVATLLLPPFGAAAPLLPAPAAATGPGNNCTSKCGNIDIPYPFGIEPGCYHAAGFHLTCRNGSEVFLGDGTVQVLGISTQNSTVRINNTRVDIWADSSTTTKTWGARIPENGPYFLSETTRNMLQVIGCGFQVSMLGGMHNNTVSSCTALCPQTDGRHGSLVATGSTLDCTTGIGCCQARILLGYSLYTIHINRLFDHENFPIAVYIVDQTYSYTTDTTRLPNALPATLDWIINNSTCLENTSAPECLSSHSYCQDSATAAANRSVGYVCKCSDGYQGNPYVPGGCQDIDECQSPDIYSCYGDCENVPGSFICKCEAGYTGNASFANGCTVEEPDFFEERGDYE